MRKTKIVCTAGPAVSGEAVLEKVIAEGCDVVRCNFSHGDYAGHRKMVSAVRKIARRLGKPVAILQDLQGPKIRFGKFSGGKALLKKGQIMTLTPENILGTENRAFVSYPRLASDLKKNDWVYFNDGLLRARVERVANNEVYVRVIEGGWVSDGKGVNLPGAKLSIPALTEKDEKDLHYGLSLDVDYVALSFVRTARDVERVKKIITKKGHEVQVIAKIEKPEAVENIDEIIRAADGIMVARGDLGVELGFEKVPSVQKRLIDLAGKEGIPVIVATQMLESMVSSPVPTRAEASDVANAVFDGADAVMLSGETATGQYPVETVRMMSKIVREAEQGREKWQEGLGLSRVKTRTPDELDVLAEAVFNIAEILDISQIVVFTRSGQTARLVSKYRPARDIIAFTPSETVLRRMALYRGVMPFHLSLKDDVSCLLSAMEKILLEEKLALPGEKVIVIFSLPVCSEKHLANTIKLHTLSNQKELISPRLR